jgi:hypothetical protein
MGTAGVGVTGRVACATRIRLNGRSKISATLSAYQRANEASKNSFWSQKDQCRVRPIYHVFVRILSKPINVVPCLAYFGGAPVMSKSRLLAVSSKRLARVEATLAHKRPLLCSGAPPGPMSPQSCLRLSRYMSIAARILGTSGSPARRDVDGMPILGGRRRERFAKGLTDLR